MKYVLGLIFVAIGISLGIYVWAWVFSGGLIQVIEASKISPVDSAQINRGVLIMGWSGVIGYLCGLVPFVLGSICLQD